MYERNFKVTYTGRGFPQYQCPYCEHTTMSLRGMEEHVGKKHPKMEAAM